MRWTAFLDLWRHLRNTVHNNGAFFDKSGKSKAVAYGGTTHLFEVGKVVTLATWPFLLGLGEDAVQMLGEVTSHPVLVAALRIDDPATSV